MVVALVRSLRPAQWVKNLFVLAPLVFAHRLDDLRLLERAGAAFALFSLAASAAYLWNDLRDREADRLHPTKSRRPIASGALPVPVAAVAALVLGAGALGGAFALGRGFALLLGSYLLLNLAYSTVLKHVAILDVMSIATGFVLRVVAGGAAIAVSISNWLLLCGGFLALFLAFAKRRHELAQASAAGAAGAQRRVLDQYGLPFLDQMISVVTASTLLCYALYTVAPETAERLGTPHLVWTIPFVLYGIFRFLDLLYQHPGEQDPTVAILGDWPFLLNFGLWGAVVVGLIYGG